MKQVKNTVFYILLFSTLTSNALCMEEHTKQYETPELYVVLIPKGTISADNRPLCVHRFFRKN